MTADGERLLTVREVADQLNVSTATIARMIDRGELKVLRLGGERGRPVRIETASLRQDMARWSRQSSQ